LWAASKLEPMLGFWLDQVHLCPSLLPWHFTSPLRTSVNHCHHLPWTIFDQNTTMPSSMSLHMHTPSPLPSKSPQHVSELALTLLITTVYPLDHFDVDIDQQPRAQTRPEAPTRDRTRMVTPRSTPERFVAPSPHTSPRSLLSPTCSPWTLQPPRQRHFAAEPL
jgi:hypothetical protein